MEAQLTIPAGIRSVRVVTADGREVPQYVTRKASTFTISDRVESEKGTMAFRRDGATLVVVANAVRIPSGVLDAISEGLRLLAGVCNGATSWDGAGFNKIDTRKGKSLAQARYLTVAQAFAGAKLVRKYRGQLIAAGRSELVELAVSILPPVAVRKPKKVRATSEQIEAATARGMEAWKNRAPSERFAGLASLASEPHNCEDFDGECCDVL